MLALACLDAADDGQHHGADAQQAHQQKADQHQHQQQADDAGDGHRQLEVCLLYTSPSPRD